jgi:hypothetical protein
MPDQMHELIEKGEIMDTVTHLFVATDNRNWTMVQDCFAPRVLFDMTSMTGGEAVTLTPEQIAESWDAGLRPLKATHHQIGNLLVSFERTGAAVFCYGIASHYLPNKSGQNTRTFVGSYDFHLVKESGKWLIDQFRFNLKYVDGNPDLERQAVPESVARD